MGTGTDRFVDATAETEVELCLPLEVDMEPDRILKDIVIHPGTVRLDALGPDSEGRSNSRTGPKRSGPEMVCRYPAPRGQLPGAGTQPEDFGDGRCTFGITSPMNPDPTQRRLGAGIQPVKPAPDRFTFGIPTPVYPSSDKQLPGLWAQPWFDRFKDTVQITFIFIDFRVCV